MLTGVKEKNGGRKGMERKRGSGGGFATWLTPVFIPVTRKTLTRNLASPRGLWDGCFT